MVDRNKNQCCTQGKQTYNEFVSFNQVLLKQRRGVKIFNRIETPQQQQLSYSVLSTRDIENIMTEEDEHVHFAQKQYKQFITCTSKLWLASCALGSTKRMRCGGILLGWLNVQYCFQFPPFSRNFCSVLYCTSTYIS